METRDLKLNDFHKYIIELWKIHKELAKTDLKNKEIFETLKSVHEWIERFKKIKKYNLPF